MESVDDLSTPADIIKTCRKHNNYTIKARPSDSLLSLVRNKGNWGEGELGKNGEKAGLKSDEDTLTLEREKPRKIEGRVVSW